MASLLCLAGALGVPTCDETVYRSFLKENSNNCRVVADLCRADEICDPVLARCVTPAPLPIAVEPANGPTTGGTKLRVSGSGFVPGCRLRIDDLWSTDSEVVSLSELTATLPAHTGRFGKVPLTVECPGGRSATNADLFSYYSGTIRLSPIEEFPVGDTPSSVATADFDGDGYLDFAAVNGKGDVSVLFNGPFGSEKGRREFKTTPSPTRVLAGDLDGDGSPDLVTLDSVTDANVFLNTRRGDGSFAAPKVASFLVLQLGELADVNLDGKLDIIGVSKYGEPVVRLGRGDGTFASTFSANPDKGGPRFMAVGDFNGDKRPDLVFSATKADSLLLWATMADGKLTPLTDLAVDAPLTGGVFTDATDDGIPDLIVSRKDRAELGLLTGTGTGGFQTMKLIPAGLTDGGGVVAADIDKDTKLDLVAADPKAGVATVLRKTGAGTYALAGLAQLGTGAVALTTLDWDRDGRLDIAAVHPSANAVRVLRSTGSLRVPGETVVPIGPQLTGAATTDWNGDGITDFAFMSSFTSNVYLSLGDGKGGLLGTTSYGTEAMASSFFAHDLTGDGKVDLLTGNANTGRLRLYRGDGLGKLSIPPSDLTLSNPTSLVVAKLDGDGTYDVAVTEQTAGVTILLGDGKGGLTKLRTVRIGPDAGGIEAADFNHDGTIDLAVFDRMNEEFRVVFGDGTGGFSAPTTYPLGPFSIKHEVADLDRDGNPDIITSSVIDRRMVIFLGTGSGTFNTVQYPTFISPDGFGIADLDGDGRQDILVGDAGDPTLRVLRGGASASNGTAGLLSEPIAVLAGVPSFNVLIADLDKDGRPDAVSQPTGAAVHMLRNLSR